MLVELVAAIGLPALYWWETVAGGLLPDGTPVVGALVSVTHVQFVCHAMLAALMLMASLIDADEKTIPDAITVPGTLFGLLAAAIYPWALLPVPDANAGVGFLHVASPLDWPQVLDGAARAARWDWWSGGFGVLVLMPRTWYRRHGLGRAVGLMLARLRRESVTWQLAVLGLIGSAAIVAVWLWGGPRWQGLATALVGMGAGGGVIWAVRIVGTAAMGREAMGFGDVTLVAMLGTLLGWQVALVVFFLAPFAGLVIGLLSLLLRRENEIPYGPFLCLAAAVLIVRWAPIWDRTALIFTLGWVVLAVMVVCLAPMGLMLAIWRGPVGALVVSVA